MKKAKTTRFPVARIKKIMQKDDEVGKVAQATPILISKALELFLADLTLQMAKVAEARNLKKVEQWHLKYAIENEALFDFLREIVANVPDPTNGGSTEESAPVEKKKRVRTKPKPEE
ncbi:hypothetical protein BS47DRAFT_1334606 [Hydnum rufescens UP504]|uniref:Transcription factor CBF/NF-Y/archaeal histone domain-containing protein n=1 Tax=Hydnum rufescens UP504 TaxID=1448309 RepID=A0A9P6AEX7_9AGAM|nr:hypothetical protein BS47DRAFT_1334606 [Hydnum rufescens UP504]